MRSLAALPDGGTGRRLRAVGFFIMGTPANILARNAADNFPHLGSVALLSPLGGRAEMLAEA